MLSFSSFARDSSDLIAMSVLAKRAALARTIICNSHATQPEMSSSAATRRPNAAVRNPTPRHQHGARSMHFGAFARASHPISGVAQQPRAICLPRGVGFSGRQCTHLCRGEPQRGDEAHQSHGWVCAARPHTPHASSQQTSARAGGRVIQPTGPATRWAAAFRATRASKSRSAVLVGAGEPETQLDWGEPRGNPCEQASMAGVPAAAVQGGV